MYIFTFVAWNSYSKLRMSKQSRFWKKKHVFLKLRIFFTLVKINIRLHWTFCVIWITSGIICNDDFCTEPKLSNNFFKTTNAMALNKTFFKARTSLGWKRPECTRNRKTSKGFMKDVSKRNKTLIYLPYWIKPTRTGTQMNKFASNRPICVKLPKTRLKK